MVAAGSVAAMPELPEVETLRTLLEPGLVGRRLERVAISDPRLTAPRDPDLVAAELAGERIASLRRRGKYLLIAFESGWTLVVHLRMTGSLRRDPEGDDPYRRALLELDDGSRLAYRDVRRFGTWHALAPGELEPYLDARLGPEPLAPGFGAATLRRRLARRRTPIKSALLDQRTVAGVGNIYADEALWRARIHPLTEAGSLSGPQLGALARAIRRALELGLARQGSTLRDYALPDGRAGSMQREFKVYGRLGEPCDRCGMPIERIRVGGRGTWYCPGCQRRPASDGRA